LGKRKSQLDIDMLIKIAQSLDTDITTLIYGLHDPADQKKEKRHLILAGGFLFILSVSLYFLTKIARDMFMNFNTSLTMLLHLAIQPIFWFVLGWTLMQGLGVLDVIKPTKSKYKKYIHTYSSISNCVVIYYTHVALFCRISKKHGSAVPL
jgi:hypothetical protein